MDSTALITSFVTIFVIIDPIGLAPLFIALTRGSDPAHRRAVALRACLIGAAILALFGLFGDAVLRFTGISMPAFRIAGGILLFLTAMDMLFERRSARRKGQASDADDPSVFPLATPLIAGPGAITSMILLTDKASGLSAQIAIYGVMLSVLMLVLVFFMASSVIEKLLGSVGVNVVTRLLGMLLAALSVQFVLDGLHGFGLAAGVGPGAGPGVGPGVGSG